MIVEAMAVVVLTIVCVFVGVSTVLGTLLFWMFIADLFGIIYRSLK